MEAQLQLATMIYRPSVEVIVRTSLGLPSMRAEWLLGFLGGMSPYIVVLSRRLQWSPYVDNPLEY